ncbi:efflux RND transporter periplasmic adaptor subunit [Dokdonella fugitiva]|uniref:Membrane fusion protein (Multidrug efflux system) n=1 Tax=Dokdonella fugitiva TaxID=328517 RepID=A0A4R2I8A9_9GAMM|nr:efflux RND transporter periplasmic adaptor subunit [Dokdonella fugitiva]TCO40262.1 membrane fusion protein (multidrug efflux system) [Dokdonella fugitiva]
MLPNFAASPKSRGFRILRTSTLAAAIALLAACGGVGDGMGKDATTQASIPVEVAPASHQTITANYSGTATLEAVGDAQVVAKTSGIVLKIFVEEGTHVQKGQVLAELDSDAARNKLAQATAALKKAQAAYDKADKGFALKITPKADYDSMKYDLETQKAIVEGAQLDLSYTRIVAPISGVIAKRSVKVGNLVQLNQALFQIVDLDPLEAVLNVPERDLDTLKAGQPVRMRVDALGGKSFDGSIARIAPVVDAASGTFRVTCAFRDTTSTLKPGMFGRIEVTYDQRHDALVVPRNAIVEEDGVSSVFVVEPAPPKDEKKDAKDAPKGKAGEAVAAETAKPASPAFVAKRRVVKTGYAEGDRIEIRDGLADGERVITIGRNAVREGTEVQVLDNATKSPDAMASLAKTEAHS